MDNLIKLNIKGISYSQTQTGAYALILEDETGSKTLPIIIGSSEAQSIALALEKDINPPRPLTHDLFVSLGKDFNLNVDLIYIYKLEDGVFFSKIVFVNEDNFRSEIDSRTSDAIALAVRFKAPIFVYQQVLEKAGIQLNNIQENNQFDNSSDESKEDSLIIEIDQDQNISGENEYESWTEEELEIEMKKAVQNENYELAARLRDQINNRENY